MTLVNGEIVTALGAVAVPARVSAGGSAAGGIPDTRCRHDPPRRIRRDRPASTSDRQNIRSAISPHGRRRRAVRQRRQLEVAIDVLFVQPTDGGVAAPVPQLQLRRRARSDLQLARGGIGVVEADAAAVDRHDHILPSGEMSAQRALQCTNQVALQLGLQAQEQPTSA
jgi:hypothetical protein